MSVCTLQLHKAYNYSLTDLTTPQMCCYTTLWNVSVQKGNNRKWATSSTVQCKDKNQKCNKSFIVPGVTVDYEICDIAALRWPVNSVASFIDDELKQHLIDARAGTEQCIIGDVINKWCRHVYVCISGRIADFSFLVVPIPFWLGCCAVKKLLSHPLAGLYRSLGTQTWHWQHQLERAAMEDREQLQEHACVSP